MTTHRTDVLRTSAPRSIVKSVAVGAIAALAAFAAADAPVAAAASGPSRGQPARLPTGLPHGGLSQQALRMVRRYPQALTAARFYRGIETADVADERDVLAVDWRNVPLNPGQGPGRAGFTADLAPYHAALPDLRVHIDELAVAGGTVTSRNTLTGTQLGPFLGVPATGRRITFRTTDVHHVDRGRIQSSYHLEDLLGALQQVTAPTPAG